MFLQFEFESEYLLCIEKELSVRFGGGRRVSSKVILGYTVSLRLAWDT